MLWLSSGIRYVKEEIVSTEPRWNRILEGLGTLGRLGLEGLLLFMYPNYILWWIIYRLEGDEEVLRRGLRFPLR